MCLLSLTQPLQCCPRIHTAPIAPNQELRDIQSTTADFAAVDPPLGLLHLVRQFPLRQPRLFTKPPQEGGHLPVDGSLIPLRSHGLRLSGLGHLMRFALQAIMLKLFAHRRWIWRT